MVSVETGAGHLILRHSFRYDLSAHMRLDLGEWRARNHWHRKGMSYRRASWRLALELRLRKSHGDMLQDFFSQMMEKTRGTRFVRVRPFGILGDQGCDGYDEATGEVFQCYGAVDGDSGKVAYLVKKMKDDFATAKEKLGELMKSWTLVHNLTSGLPIHAVHTLKELQKENPDIPMKFMGIEGFAKEIFELDDVGLEELLGLAAQAEDTLSLQPTELRDLVNELVQNNAGVAVPPPPIRPVPVDKIQLNNLPVHWQHLIQMGWQNSYVVSEYLTNYHDPLAGELIATDFRNRYAYLKAQDLSPDEIMTALYEVVVGPGPTAPPRQVAGFALLAYYFDSCDIFEDHAKVGA